MLVFLSQAAISTAQHNGIIASETLTITVYLDGYVSTFYELMVNESYPAVNATLIGQSFENLLVEDEQHLPLDFSMSNGTVTVYSLGANIIRISYLSQDLTLKTGRLWTFRTETSTNITLILPEGASIISLSNVPDVIESLNSQVTLIMPPGQVEITYILEHGLTDQMLIQGTPWNYIVAVALLSAIIIAVASIGWHLKRKKQPKQEQLKESIVDIEKLLEKEKDLRQEEVQVIRFLAEKNGTAFEAELYEKLMLPRTTTWRMLKRLEKMEIIDIRKSRRQNIVTVRKKYLKSSRKP
jgi:uncharacterized membrane protein